MKRILLLLMLVLFLYSNSIAQVTYAKPKDYDKIFSRVLVIELLEENPKIVANLQKSEKKNPGELAKYKNFIAKYNKMIQEIAPKYWNLNATIEFKSSTEITKIQKSKSLKYVCLYYTESKLSTDYSSPMVYRSSLTIPTFNYNRAENKKVKPDYSFFLPVKDTKHENFSEFDLIFAFQLMQANLEYNKSKNKKNTATQFAEKISKENCSKLAGKKLLVDKTLLHPKVNKSDISGVYQGKFEIVDQNGINTSVLEANPDEAYIAAIPVTIVKGSLGPITGSRITAIRVVVESSTGAILGCIGTKMGEFNDFNIRESDFKKFQACK